MERSSGEARAVQQAKQCLVLMPGAQALAGIVGVFSWARPTRAAHAPPEAVTDTALRRGLCDSGHVKGLWATGTRRRVSGTMRKMRWRPRIGGLWPTSGGICQPIALRFKEGR